MSDNEQNLNSLECWDYSIELEYLQGSQDLQLAAELGKTLLERNKELEAALVERQGLIEDKDQEIEHLTKQSAALREVSDSRLRIYEQLEISIQDLERANHRLILENSAGKKHIKTLTATIEGLETKCSNLQTTIDDLKVQVDALKRKAQLQQQKQSETRIPSLAVLRDDGFANEDYDDEPYSPEAKAKHKGNLQCKTSTPYKTEKPLNTRTGTTGEASDETDDSNSEQMSQLLAQLRESKTQTSRDQRRITELEEQLATILQQNQALENQVIKLAYKDEGMKSMYDEISTLEEVRNGQMCSRCLRSVARDGSEDDIPEDDDHSMLEALSAVGGGGNTGPGSQHRSSFSMEVQDHTVTNQSSSTPNSKEHTNLYKELVEKYEALLEIHRQPSSRNHHHQANKRASVGGSNSSNCMSLQEELQMSSGDFNTNLGMTHGKDTDDDESGHGDSLKPIIPNNKGHHPTIISHTPTDFSEAETSSSGFSDETSNKCTQTEDRPGSFLCSIAAGDDCKLSIYDEVVSPISSRFRNQPAEYQELFKEIFMVLKNTAENKVTTGDTHAAGDEGLQTTEQSVQMQTDNTKEEICLELIDDDSQSVVSSTMSELSMSQNEPTTIIENLIQSQNQPIPEPSDVEDSRAGASTPRKNLGQHPSTATPQERVLRPLVRQPLEYISVETRKRSTSKRNKNKMHDRSDSPAGSVMTHIIGSPKITYSSRPSSGRRRRSTQNTSGGAGGSSEPSPQKLPQKNATPTSLPSGAPVTLSCENDPQSAWNGATLQFWSTNRHNLVSSPTPSQGSGKAGYFEFKPSSASHDLHKLKRLDLSYAEVLRNADTNNKRKMVNSNGSRHRSRK